MVGEIIEIEDSYNFDEAEWIGQGKTFPKDPKDVPLALAWYRSEQLSLPQYAEDQLNNIYQKTINEFVAMKLPKCSYSITFKQPRTCFHKDEPNDAKESHFKTFSQCTIPPADFVKGALEHAGQAILNRSKSFEDPQYPSSQLPLWALEFWRQILHMEEIHKKWAQCSEWLNTQLQQGREGQVQTGEPMKAHRNMGRLRWGGVTKVPGTYNDTTTSNFTRLLGSEWISSTLMDMMFAYLNSRLKADTVLDTHIVVETLRVMRDLSKATLADSHKSPLSGFLWRLEECINASPDDVTLLFPAYIERFKHWIAIRVDFRAGTWCYGEF
jgi:hypothetical protein